MGNPSAPSPAVPRGRSTSTVRTRAQHPGPFGRAGGHDQMLARSRRARKAGICLRRTARHRGTPRESSARMRSASPQPGRSSTPARLRLDSGSRRRVLRLLCSILRCALSNAEKECGCPPWRSYGVISEFRSGGVETSELPNVCTLEFGARHYNTDSPFFHLSKHLSAFSRESPVCVVLRQQSHTAWLTATVR